MTLLAVERIKLFSTRAPVWCVATALALTIGATAGLVWLNGRHSDGVTPESTQTWSAVQRTPRATLR